MAEDREDLFLSIAIDKGLLTSEQAEECRGNRARFAEMGFSRTLAQICREKSLLSAKQIAAVRREMAQQGVFP